MFLRFLDPVQRCPVSLPFSLPGLCPVEPEPTSIVIFLGAQGFSDLFTSDSKISKVQRMPIDPLTYEHLVCAESGDTMSLLFLVFQSVTSVTKRHLDYSIWVKRFSVGGQSDKRQRWPNCGGVFQSSGKVEIKEVKEFQKMLLAEHFCQVMSCNGKYGV